MDELYWSHERHGNFSVCSAYKLSQVQKSWWSLSDNQSNWSKIWRIRAPTKVLNLVGRSLSNCLPSVVSLQQKGVVVEFVCPVCKGEPKTVDHVFIHCAVTVQCWQLIIPNMQSTSVSLVQW